MYRGLRLKPEFILDHENNPNPDNFENYFVFLPRGNEWDHINIRSRTPAPVNFDHVVEATVSTRLDTILQIFKVNWIDIPGDHTCLITRRGTIYIDSSNDREQDFFILSRITHAINLWCYIERPKIKDMFEGLEIEDIDGNSISQPIIGSKFGRKEKLNEQMAYDNLFSSVIIWKPAKSTHLMNLITRTMNLNEPYLTMLEHFGHGRAALESMDWASAFSICWLTIEEFIKHISGSNQSVFNILNTTNLISTDFRDAMNNARIVRNDLFHENSRPSREEATNIVNVLRFILENSISPSLGIDDFKLTAAGTRPPGNWPTNSPIIWWRNHTI